ncbi:hypothetical protein CEXT_372131 [Caerostris extrusa]|uniref:Uncharacterized protein n=1 Tax=Caerostris extrusa TaxID=172846 RepID=A0AAV4NWZ7_CAEEX|nr:hypothetical protein CEXT_372131 [Caerostris extrusa]
MALWGCRLQMRSVESRNNCSFKAALSMARGLWMRRRRSPNCYMLGLELRRLRVEDSGEVVLVVKNAHGIADALFLLNVTRASSLSASSSASEGLRGSSFLTLLIPVCLLWLRHRVLGCCQLTLPLNRLGRYWVAQLIEEDLVYISQISEYLK